MPNESTTQLTTFPPTPNAEHGPKSGWVWRAARNSTAFLGVQRTVTCHTVKLSDTDPKDKKKGNLKTTWGCVRCTLFVRTLFVIFFLIFIISIVIALAFRDFERFQIQSREFVFFIFFLRRMLCVLSVSWHRHEHRWQFILIWIRQMLSNINIWCAISPWIWKSQLRVPQQSYNIFVTVIRFWGE